MGININRIISFTFVLGSVPGGRRRACCTRSSTRQVDPLMGLLPGSRRSSRRCSAGSATSPAPSSAAIVLGLVEVLVVGYLPNGSAVPRRRRVRHPHRHPAREAVGPVRQACRRKGLTSSTTAAAAAPRRPPTRRAWWHVARSNGRVPLLLLAARPARLLRRDADVVGDYNRAHRDADRLQHRRWPSASSSSTASAGSSRSATPGSWRSARTSPAYPAKTHSGSG